MVGFVQDGKRVVTAAQDAGATIFDKFADLFKGSEEAAKAAADRAMERARASAKAAETAERSAGKIAGFKARETAAKQSMKTLEQLADEAAAANPGRLSKIGSKIGNAIGTSFKAGVKLVEVPVAVFVLKPARMALNGTTKLFNAFPKAVPIAVIGTAVVGGATWLANRKSENLQNEFMAQAAATEAAMNAAPQAPVSWKNTVTEADMAAMQARREADGKAGASQQEALAARTAAASPAATTSVA
jgi:hypothetical protein